MSEFVCSPDNSIKITKWKVREGYRVSAGQLVLLYVDADSNGKEIKRLKSSKVGVVQKRLYKEGEIVQSGLVCCTELKVLRHIQHICSAVSGKPLLNSACAAIRLSSRTCVRNAGLICVRMRT